MGRVLMSFVGTACSARVTLMDVGLLICRCSLPDLLVDE